MSSFITTKEQIKPHPVINNTIRKIAFNPRSFRGSLNPLPPAQQQRQQSFLKEICHRINIQQRQKIRIQAHQQATNQLSSLKNKLRRNITQENIQYMMGDKKGDNKDILSKVMRIPIQTVSIEKAHRRKINLKLELMVEAEQITNNKEQYQRWYDSNKNSSTSSPIFKKINFLLQRMSRQQDPVLPSYPNCRSSLDSELLQSKVVSNYHKINRKKTEGCELAKW